MIFFVGVTVFVVSAIAATFLIETVTRLLLFVTAPDFQLLTGFSGVNWTTFINARNFIRIQEGSHGCMGEVMALLSG
jgi:type IV secretion system protein VirD4